ncbi:hypothetical protein L596_011229 [Steinernema carpocapsae]|uniref:Uncharacterized protein n=1 Tax=Steinernema carpocapsae TaxID=34508 RepID=A0A4U5NU17_STECR|nr:hypothetical protein L596_011229 [Steinernema carpocapsae]
MTSRKLFNEMIFQPIQFGKRDQFIPSSVIASLQNREIGISRRSLIAPKTLTTASKRTLYQRDVKGHFGCVNSVEFSTDECRIASGGDDLRVLVWNVADFQVNPNPECVATMESRHTSNIFTISFSKNDDRIYSGGNDAHFLIHDLVTTKRLRVHRLPGAINYIETNPVDDQMVLTASDDSCVRLFDMRDQSSNGAIVVEPDSGGTTYCAKFNPYQSNLVAVCSQFDNLEIYDVRKTDEACCPTYPELSNVMFVDWDELGHGMVGIRSKNEPFFYNIFTGIFCEFESLTYRNTHTMKSCSYLTPGYLITGSDNWDIFLWKIPSTNTMDDYYESHQEHMTIRESAVLAGHRSIVNHVRYSKTNDMIMSCGVEKIIKCWSAYGLANGYRDPQRRRLVPSSHNSSEPPDSVEEDLNMLTMFDNLSSTTAFGSDSSDSSSSDDDTNMSDIGSVDSRTGSASSS